MKGFFYPRSVVVIGVSEKRKNMGRRIVRNIIGHGFTGQVHAVGPHGGVILGRPIRKSVKDITFDMDMAVILTPAPTVPALVRECGEVGIRRIVIESAGFSELSGDRKALEEELMEIASACNIRFMGPNCLGVINTENGLASPFIALADQYLHGKVSVVSQSGGVAKSYMDYFEFDAVHLNKVVSIGNKLNVDESDLLDYLVNEDPGSEIICLYLEGLTHARRFLEIARSSKKPIIVHKAGVGEAGAASAASHTAALATDDKVVDAAFRQVGIIRVNSMNAMLDCVKVFKLPPLKGRNLAIISRSGGLGVIAADTAEHFGFHLPQFPAEALEKISAHVRGGVINLRNPLDLGDLFDLSVYQLIAQMVLTDPQIHGVILVHGYSDGEKQGSRIFMHMVKDLGETYQKPVALCPLVNDRESAYLKQNFDFPCFKSPEEAAWALNISYKVNTYRRRPDREFRPLVRPLDTAFVDKMLAQAIKEHRNPSQAECFRILAQYQLPIPAYQAVRTSNEAVRAAEKIGYPVVLKVDMPAIVHKSDMGGVVLNLADAGSVEAVFGEMSTRLKPHLPPDEPFAALLMKQAADNGQEVIMGAKQDPTFGPTILFGLGGIFAELLEDISLRVLPADRSDVMEMIREIKSSHGLGGARGRTPNDIESLADNLLKLAQLVQDFSQIKEIDLNPVMSYSKGSQVLDARFIIV